MLSLMGGNTRPFATTFKTVAYVSGVGQFFFVMTLVSHGGLLVGLWGLAWQTIALSHAHEISIGRALIAALVPSIVLRLVTLAVSLAMLIWLVQC
jgi:hypothetical protein